MRTSFIGLPIIFNIKVRLKLDLGSGHFYKTRFPVFAGQQMYVFIEAPDRIAPPGTSPQTVREGTKGQGL